MKFVTDRRTLFMTSSALAFTLPIQMPGFYSISFGFLLAIFLSPTIVPAVARIAKGYALGKSALMGAAATPLIIWISLLLDPARSFSPATAITACVLLFGFLIQIGSILWSAYIVGVVRVAILYGAGATLNAVMNPQSWSTNPWKYAFAWPVSVVLIALLSKHPKSLQPVAIGVVAVFALAHASRNSAGVLILAFLATSATFVFYRGVRRRRAFLILGILAAGSLAIVSVVTQLALNGDLGSELQQTQISQSSSRTPIPGRVEYAATFALMRHNPIGLGPGVAPSAADIEVGKSGLAAIGAATSGEYINGQMFANDFEVHSVAGDLWVKFGIPGLFLAGALLTSLVRATILNHTSRPSGHTALCSVLFFQAVWDLLFSPLNANFRTVGFATGIAIYLIATAREGSSIAMRQEWVATNGPTRTNRRRAEASSLHASTATQIEYKSQQKPTSKPI